MLYCYDSKSRKKVLFEPIRPGRVSLYTCGVTVYDHCHLGHGRTFTVFDMIVRHLKSLGYDVKYVRNITDIDDKILQRSGELGQPWEALVAQMTHEMHSAFEQLNLLSPTEEPRASQYIPQMIDLVQKLIQKKHAYIEENGDVYFSVSSFSDYGHLSKQPLDKLQTSGRRLVTGFKRNPLDFVLWKSEKPGEPSWQTPWGSGRPGWHIECSAMSHACLGASFDIHGGGSDLCFPHHENEVAQSLCGYDGSFAQNWIHVAMMTIEEEKMAKSLNNFILLKDVLAHYPPEVVRFYYLSAHYRSELQYHPNRLVNAYHGLNRLYTALHRIGDDHATREVTECEVTEMLSSEFEAAMNDDFNTPKAYAVLFKLAHHINRLKQHAMPKARYAIQKLTLLGNRLGFLKQRPEQFFREQGVSESLLSEIQDAIEKREMARRAGDWEAADAIRAQLVEKSIILEDLPEGTSWKKFVQ